jgi:MFS family permease
VAEGEFATLDEQAFKAFHWRATLTTGLGVFCDGYDLTSVGIVLPLILDSFGHISLSGLQSATLVASTLVGSVLGGLIFGVLGQSGRRRFYGLDMLILGFAALAQAFAPDLTWLIAIRFVLGIGVGADYVLSPMIMAEHANRADRGRALGLGFGTMWPFGALIAAVAQITGVTTAAPRADTRAFGAVFARHWRAIFSAALLWMVYDTVVYAGILFGPSLIAKSLGLGPVSFSLLMQLVFTLPPAILMSLFLIDQVGRKPLQVWGFVATALAVGVFALMQDQLLQRPILALIVFGLYNVAATAPGIVSGAGVLGVELAPTRIRSVAQSITVAGGRIGAALSAFAFPLLFAGIGQAGAYWVIAALAVLGAVLTQVLVPETGRVSLEALSEGA